MKKTALLIGFSFFLSFALPAYVSNTAAGTVVSCVSSAHAAKKKVKMRKHLKKNSTSVKSHKRSVPKK